MNQANSLDEAINLAKSRAINLAERMAESDALYIREQDKAKELLVLLDDPKKNLSGIELHAEYSFKRVSDASSEKRKGYFKNDEEGTRLYEEMTNLLNDVIMELKTDKGQDGFEACFLG